MTDSLFSDPGGTPWPRGCGPSPLAEVVGQQHVVGAGTRWRRCWPVARVPR